MKNSTFFKAFLAVGLTTLLGLSTQARSLAPTIYFIKTVDLDQVCAVKKNIMSVDGKVLFKVCPDAYKKCVIEGTCAILDDEDNIPGNSSVSISQPDQIKETIEGEMNLSVSSEGTPTDDAENDESKIDVINYVKQDKKGNALFMDVEGGCKWGFGVNAICLDPFYSVAADLTQHKAGEVIFVNKLKGVNLPNGETHSGFMIIRDRGGAIKGYDRYDFYTGNLSDRDPRNPFGPLQLGDQHVAHDYRMATADEAANFRKLRNYPKIPIEKSAK